MDWLGGYNQRRQEKQKGTTKTANLTVTEEQMEYEKDLQLERDCSGISGGRGNWGTSQLLD